MSKCSAILFLMSLVVPAVLPSSHKELEEGLALFAQISSVDRVQIDIVDGKFASPASWPFSAPAEIQTMLQKGEMLPYLDQLEYEIDLMCLDAEQVAGMWLALGATRLTFHLESAINVPLLLASARRRFGSVVSFGLAVNLATDQALIESCVSQGELSYVQFMGIGRIGRQGQVFDRRVLEKVRLFLARHPLVPVQVDGGVTLENAKELVALGVSNLVIGSQIVKALDPSAAVATFEALQSPYGV